MPQKNPHCQESQGHLPSKPWDLNRRHLQGQVSICSRGTEIYEKTPVLPANGVKHPRKKGTNLGLDNWDGWRDCSSSSGCIVQWDTLWTALPNEKLLCQITHQTRNTASLFLYVHHHSGIVTRLDHGLSRDPIPEGIQVQLKCLHLQDIHMEIVFFLCPYPCYGWVLHMCTPTSPQHIWKQKKG